MNACELDPAHADPWLPPDLRDELQEVFVRRTGQSRAFVGRQVTELLRFLYLVSAHPRELAGRFLPVEQGVDDVWHYLILQTREYRQLTEHTLPGRFFIEHRSVSYGDYGNAEDRTARAREGLRWIPFYCAAFGPFDAAALVHWTMPRFLHEHMGISLASIAAITDEAPR